MSVIMWPHCVQTGGICLLLATWYCITHLLMDSSGLEHIWAVCVQHCSEMSVFSLWQEGYTVGLKLRYRVRMDTQMDTTPMHAHERTHLHEHTHTHKHTRTSNTTCPKSSASRDSRMANNASNVSCKNYNPQSNYFIAHMHHTKSPW